MLETRFLRTKAFLKQRIRLAPAVGVGVGNGLEFGWECTYCVDGAFVLALGFLDFGRATYVGSRFVYLEEGAKFAYGVNDPVLAERLEFLHTLERCDRCEWNPVVVVRGVETPHKSEGTLEKRWSVGSTSYLSNGRLASAK